MTTLVAMLAMTLLASASFQSKVATLAVDAC
jgi:hypothetical protein